MYMQRIKELLEQLDIEDLELLKRMLEEEKKSRFHFCPYLNGGGNRCPNMEVKKDLHPLWDDLIEQTEEGPEALIRLVKDRLEAWADTARIVWNGSGSEAAKNQMENYSALAHALGKTLKLMRQKN